METLPIVMLVLVPLLCGISFLILRNKTIRNVIILVGATVLIGSSLSLAHFLGYKSVNFQSLTKLNLNEIMTVLDFVLMLYVLFVGIRLRSWLVGLLISCQIALMVFVEMNYASLLKKSQAVFYLDGLSIVMTLIVSIIGSLIALYAIGYMKNHEEHLKVKKSRQPQFFFVVFLFLAAMNGLVLSDNLLWMSFFWEITTVCSFLLISHDRTEQAINNAKRALWINLLGGIAFIVGTIIILNNTGYVLISVMLDMCQGLGSFKELISVAVMFLCIAGFTKSAQLPFQSWLLGAMVAPTPVSALLHSSTLVKAGVYLIIRLSPALAGTKVGLVVAISGGFTFAAASAAAISQSNAKKLLAYSTIANLGLIIACAGIGSAAAIGAAILLIIFHALSKALMFLCVGTIEQQIGSREIEDMEGIMNVMPFTAVISAIAAASMLFPPFGVLVSKWLAIETAVRMPVVLVLIVLGSAFTAVFWLKFIGKLLTSEQSCPLKREKLNAPIFISLSVLALGVAIASLCIVPLYNYFVSPEFANSSGLRVLAYKGIINVTDKNIVGSFEYIALFAVLAIIALVVPILLKKSGPVKIRQPYMCGENCEVQGHLCFRGDADKETEVVFKNYYLKTAFGEESLNFWLTLMGVLSIISLFTSIAWRLI